MRKHTLGAFECKYIDVGAGSSVEGARIVLRATMRNCAIRVPTISLDLDCARALATALIQAADEAEPKAKPH